MTLPLEKPAPEETQAAPGRLRVLVRAVLQPGPLARRMALAIILFSSALALLITAAELSKQYLGDVQQIDGRMEQIRAAYLESLTEDVWVTDRQRIDTQLLGITRLPDFVQAEIRVDGKSVYSRGHPLQGAGSVQVFDLERLYQGRMQHIGQLVVSASYAGAWQRALDAAVFILVSNAAKTLLVAGFIFALFYRQIGQHLERVAEYAKTRARTADAQPLQLARRARRRPDELSHLVDAINQMHDELAELNRRQAEQLTLLGEQAELLDLAHDAIIVRDLNNRILFWNHGAEVTYGWARGEALGRPLHQLLQANLPESLLNIEDTLFRLGHWEGQIGHTTRKGERLVVASRWAVKYDDAGRPEAVLEINRDVTERRLIEERIERLALTDPLTQLPNRLRLDQLLRQALETARRHEGLLAVLFVDLDHFKDINDRWGHDAGDQLLVEVGQRLKACVRETDVVARLSSDEFVVVLTSLKNDAVVAPTTTKVQEALRQPFDVGVHKVYTACTIGVSIYPRHGDDPRVLLKHADNAMYLGKTQGRGVVRFFEGD